MASTVPVDEYQLWDLARGVRELSRVGASHGDICYWNVILQQPPDLKADAASTRLLLIDLGGPGQDYKDDIDGLGNVLLWCLQYSPALTADAEAKKRVVLAAALLKEGNLDQAIEVLSSSIVGDGHKRA